MSSLKLMKQAKGQGTVAPLAQVGSHQLARIQGHMAAAILQLGERIPWRTEKRIGSSSQKVSQADKEGVLSSIQSRDPLKTCTQGALADKPSLPTYLLPIAFFSTINLAVPIQDLPCAFGDKEIQLLSLILFDLHNSTLLDIKIPRPFFLFTFE